MNISKLKPQGPWILVKVDPPEEISMGGLYMPQGNLEERLGNATGRVVALGQGKRTKDKVYKRTNKKYEPIDLELGSKIAFRGHLQEANKPSYLDSDHCLIHVDDVIGEVMPESSVR